MSTVNSKLLDYGYRQIKNNPKNYNLLDYGYRITLKIMAIGELGNNP